MAKAVRIAKAQQMHDGGASYRAIGRALGVQHNTVRCWLDPTALADRRDRNAIYRVSHRDEAKVRTAVYRIAHPKEARDQSKRYCALHREEARVRSAAWHRTHLAEARAHSAARHALKIGALIGATATQLSEIKEIYRRAKNGSKVRCYLCGRLIPLGQRHVDHIMPLSKGGAHKPSNLAVACDACNLHKHAKLPYEVGVLL